LNLHQPANDKVVQMRKKSSYPVIEEFQKIFHATETPAEIQEEITSFSEEQQHLLFKQFAKIVHDEILFVVTAYKMHMKVNG
jgi:hypothetical protein